MAYNFTCGDAANVSNGDTDRHKKGSNDQITVLFSKTITITSQIILSKSMMIEAKIENLSTISHYGIQNNAIC